MLTVAYKKKQVLSCAVAILQDKVGPANIASYEYLVGATQPFGKKDVVVDSLIIGGINNGTKIDFAHTTYPVGYLQAGSDEFKKFALNRFTYEHLYKIIECKVFPRSAFLVSDQLLQPVLITYNDMAKRYERAPYRFVSRKDVLQTNPAREKSLDNILNRFYGVL